MGLIRKDTKPRFRWTDEALARLRELWLTRKYPQREVAEIMSKEFGQEITKFSISFYLGQLGLRDIKPDLGSYANTMGVLLVLTEPMLADARRMWADAMPLEGLIRTLKQTYPELSCRNNVTIRRRLIACGAIQPGVHHKSRTISRAEVAASMPDPVVLHKKAKPRGLVRKSFRGSLRDGFNHLDLEATLSPRIQLRAEIMRELLETSNGRTPTCAEIDAVERDRLGGRVTALPARKRRSPAIPKKEAA